MATYYVWSGASGTNAGTSWTNAYTAFASAVTAATTNGDIIKVSHVHQEELAAAPTYTMGADVYVVSVDKDSSDAATSMGEGGWIGNSTTARNITINGAKNVLFHGITFRATSASLSFNTSDGGQFTFENCKVWGSITTVNVTLVFGTTNINCYTKLENFEFKSARTTSGSWSITAHGRVDWVGGSAIAAAGTSAALFADSGGSSGPNVRVDGVDLSGLPASQTLVASMSRQYAEYSFVRCKLPTTATVLATQTPANKSSGHVWVHDCSTGDTHGLFGYYNALGSIVSDTGIYYTSGAAAQSWKVTTASTCTFGSPFETPWIDFYNTGTSAVTPRLEILRDGSTTAFTKAQVWAELAVKSNTGSTLAAISEGKQSLTDFIAGTTASDNSAGAGLGSWTGESGTAWSGKVDCGSVTPAEVGALSMRVCVAAASISGTLFIDPQIRTA